jgi:hypothetical protein
VPSPKKVHESTRRRLRTLEEVEKLFPGFKAFIDATEQEIPRPKKDERKRKTHYSGKKTRHTVKTQLTVNNKDGLIVHKTNHARGRTHDYELFKHSHPWLPKKCGQWSTAVTTGYRMTSELRPMIPFKRRGGGRGRKGIKGDDLTPSQKRFNRALSKERVVVEHTISRVKKFRIMTGEFRNRLKRYDVMTDIISGLVNLRIWEPERSESAARCTEAALQRIIITTKV